MALGWTPLPAVAHHLLITQVPRAQAADDD
jgi:hypothetical protein